MRHREKRQPVELAMPGMARELGWGLLLGMAEEMMFRSILFGVTARALGSKAAIVISSLMFAMAHLPNAGFSLLTILAIISYGVL